VSEQQALEQRAEEAFEVWWKATYLWELDDLSPATLKHLEHLKPVLRDAYLAGFDYRNEFLAGYVPG